MNEHPELREARFIKTHNSAGNENGWVTEVLKDGDKTVAYQTTVMPTADEKTPIVKGWHAYRRQTNRLTCTSGFVTIKVMWNEHPETDNYRLVTYKLAEHRPAVLTIPPGNPFAILNYSTYDFGRVINHPDPLWDAENFKTDQYEWIPNENQLKQNGEIVDLSEFVSPESELPETVDHP